MKLLYQKVNSFWEALYMLASKFALLCVKVSSQTPAVTWRCRERCRLGKPSAWCSPWWCREWTSAWSARRRHQAPRSSSPAGRRRCGSGCFPREKPDARLSSSASGRASWWSPEEEETGTRLTHQRSDPESQIQMCKKPWSVLPCWPPRCCPSSPPVRRCPQEWQSLQGTVKAGEEPDVKRESMNEALPQNMWGTPTSLKLEMQEYCFKGLCLTCWKKLLV